MPEGFFRVEEFTDLLVFVNYVCNWKIWRPINDVFKQFYWGCDYVPTVNEKSVYNKLWTEDDCEGASKCPLSSWFKPSGYSVFSFRIQKFFRFFWSRQNCLVVAKVFIICLIRINFASLWKAWYEFWKRVKARIEFLFLLSLLWLFNLILKEVSLLPTNCSWQIRYCSNWMRYKLLQFNWWKILNVSPVL